MAKGFWIAIVILVLIIGGFFVFSSDSEEEQDHSHDEMITEKEEVVEEMQEDIRGQVGVHEINMTLSGFSPRTLSINIGDSVVFVNQGASRWPASDLHPSHKNYPGSGIEKCGTAEEEGIFDSCGAVKDTWTFKFEDDGEWRYHDHLSPGARGTILVV